MSFDSEEENGFSQEKAPENFEAEAITRLDVKKVKFFVPEIFEKMLHATGTKVDLHMTHLVLEHTSRVAHIAEHIAEQAGLDVDLVKFEALCHDCQKLHPQKLGGINEIVDHAAVAAGPLPVFMVNELRKTKDFIEKVCREMFDHISTPNIVGTLVQKDRLPGNIYSYVLRCANMLDYVGMSGLAYEVEQRQRKKTLAYNEDRGDLSKSFVAACKKRGQFLKDLFNNYPLYRATWKGFDDQLYKVVQAIRVLARTQGAQSKEFIEFLEKSKPRNIGEFRKMFKFFSEQQLLR